MEICQSTEPKFSSVQNNTVVHRGYTEHSIPSHLSRLPSSWVSSLSTTPHLTSTSSSGPSIPLDTYGLPPRPETIGGYPGAHSSTDSGNFWLIALYEHIWIVMLLPNFICSFDRRFFITPLLVLPYHIDLQHLEITFCDSRLPYPTLLAAIGGHVEGRNKLKSLAGNDNIQPALSAIH